jgi:hypothetical protein
MTEEFAVGEICFDCSGSGRTHFFFIFFLQNFGAYILFYTTPSSTSLQCWPL